jgi:hypothetical protein
MGRLSTFDLSYYIEKYNLNTFVETGTYKGDGVMYANQFNFQKIFSIEVISEFYEECVNKFSNNKKINLINLDSLIGLDTVLKKLNKKDKVLFWLDAHLPNFYKKDYGNDYKNNKNLLIPLEEELKIISSHENYKNYVFIIDDLRIYEKGNFSSGNWLDVINYNLYNGVDFIYSILEDTHNISKDYRDEGYIICTPK